jgi:hypothetical protein
VYCLITGTEGQLLLMNEGDDLQLWRKSESGKRAVETIPVEPQSRSLMYQALEDLIHAMDTGAPTRCNETHAARALEMALGFHASERAGNARVNFPLADRDLSVDTW